jgi:hypothetical protein
MKDTWKAWKGNMETPPFYEGESYDTIHNQIFEKNNVEFFSNQILFFVEGDCEVLIGHYVRLENGSSYFRSNLGDDYNEVLFWALIPPFPPSIFS